LSIHRPIHAQHTTLTTFRLQSQPADHPAANVKGTGLGLVITKAIIECMGGNIDFESIENEYTRFFFKVRPCAFPKS